MNVFRYKSALGYLQGKEKEGSYAKHTATGEKRDKVSSIRASDIVCVLAVFSGAFSEAVRYKISSGFLNKLYEKANWKDYTTFLEYFFQNLHLKFSLSKFFV